MQGEIERLKRRGKTIEAAYAEGQWTVESLLLVSQVVTVTWSGLKLVRVVGSGVRKAGEATTKVASAASKAEAAHFSRGSQSKPTAGTGNIKPPIGRPQLAGRGSTAGSTSTTRHPVNQKEKLAIEEVMAEPKKGRLIPEIKMHSPWPQGEGWYKYRYLKEVLVETMVDGKVEYIKKRIEVHYLYNEKLNLIDDYKIKIPEPRKNK